MEITQKEFNMKFKKLPTNIQKDFILKCGIKKKFQNVLLLWYVEQLDYTCIADRIGMQVESVANLIVEARKQLRNDIIINYDYDENFRKEIDLLLK